ncbi:MAG: hypothetical protein RL033_7902 [Pseudomonadota bacterium]
MTNEAETPKRINSGSSLDASEGRVFVRDGLRSFRKTYRVREVYWGAGILAFLAGVFAWVRHKGANPDPSLYDMSAALAAGPVNPEHTPVERSGANPERHPQVAAAAHGGPAVDSAAVAAQRGAVGGAVAQRGALPDGLAIGGFGEGKIGAYTPENLYVKINGRAEFYESFGVQSMHAVTLESPSGTSIEIELYDLGAARNALGTYNGERPPGQESQVENGTYFRFDRNAAFLARGTYYVRFVGSDESPPVVAEVRRLVQLFKDELPGAELPWAFGLFVDQLKLPASTVSYARENAFSFGFASDVYKATLSAPDAVDNMEAFVSVKADPAQAKGEAKQYQDGFKSLGLPAGKTPAGVPLFKDEFLGTFSTATASERWVVGVRGAPSAARAAEVLKQLEQGLRAMPADVRAGAQPSNDSEQGEAAGGAAPLVRAEPGQAEPAGAAGGVGGAGGSEVTFGAGAGPSAPASPSGGEPAKPAQLEGDEQ